MLKKHFKSIALSLTCVAMAATLSACGGDKTAKDAPETKNVEGEAAVVNIYSYRKEALIKPLLDKFSEKSGIKVNLLTGKADALFQRLQSEGEHSPADILITSDAGRLHRAKAGGLLQAVESEALTKNIPEHLRDPQNEWFGLSQRARVIFYNKDKVKPEELSTYEALTDAKWKGRICIRSSDNIYNQSLLASIIEHDGKEKALEWAKGMVANFARKPQGGDRDQLKAVATGACDIAIANTYYFGGWLVSGDKTTLEMADKIGVFMPNQAGRGAHMNISGAGVTKYAKNKDNAVKLIEYLSSKEAQEFYSQANQEYPVNAEAPVSDLLKSWGYPFKVDQINLSKLGENNPEAIKIFDVAQWP